MPRIDSKIIYYWGRREKELNNTERHMIFRKELYPHAHLPAVDFALILAQFRTNHPELCED